MCCVGSYPFKNEFWGQQTKTENLPPPSVKLDERSQTHLHSTLTEIVNLVSATFQGPETFTEINGLP